MSKYVATADNTAYTLRAYALPLRDSAFGNVVYAGTVSGHCNNKLNNIKKYRHMKRIGLTFILLLKLCLICKTQTLRYFEFNTNCGHGNWKDTSFIASTSNQVVIDSVLANIARPLNQRNFISGPIT